MPRLQHVDYGSVLVAAGASLRHRQPVLTHTQQLQLGSRLQGRVQQQHYSGTGQCYSWRAHCCSQGNVPAHTVCQMQHCAALAAVASLATEAQPIASLIGVPLTTLSPASCRPTLQRAAAPASTPPPGAVHLRPRATTAQATPAPSQTLKHSLMRHWTCSPSPRWFGSGSLPVTWPLLYPLASCRQIVLLMLRPAVLVEGRLARSSVQHLGAAVPQALSGHPRQLC